MDAAIKLQLKKIAERIDEMLLRERAMLFIVVMGVLYAFASMVFFAPLQVEQARLGKELKSKRDQMQVFDKQIQAIVEENSKGGGQRSRVSILREKLGSLDASLTGITQGLVPPKEMARLVEQVLKRNRALEVIRVENLPPAPLLDAKDGIKTTQQIVYKHGLRIQFKGRYTDIVNYLRALESLPWKVFWGEISLQTEAYPFSTITLVVYTLSLQQGWIGV
jgi:MSHA biogenesis protein MshJ